MAGDTGVVAAHAKKERTDAGTGLTVTGSRLTVARGALLAAVKAA
ncbi:hypothetical protein ACRU3B_16580 [Mycobacterium colombiense]